MNKSISLLLFFFFFAFYINAQKITLTADQIRALTPEWNGERFADGRPKVSDQLLERLKNVSMEEAWGYL
ncbi:MAG TPA: hypothetical protein VK711_03645, partial [Puia sp.]|nr:hypothetical protein [Puia sp.]